MAKITNTVRQFKGYINSVEVTNIPDTGYLVAGSKNVVVSKNKTVAQRSGYEEYATYTGVLTGGSKGSFTWMTSRGDFFMVKKIGSDLLLRMTKNDGFKWVKIPVGNVTGIDPNSKLQFSKIWDPIDLIDRLVFSAGGNKKFFSWSGKIAEVESVDVGASTVTFTKTLGEIGINPAIPNTLHFFKDVNKNISFTGGSGKTLTGIFGDVTDLVVGDILTGALSQHNVSSYSPDIYKVTAIGVSENRVYLSSDTSYVVLVSKDSAFDDFTASNTIGSGKKLTLDDNIIAFVNGREGEMLAFGKSDSIFKINFKQSSDLTKEMSVVSRLMSSSQQGLISPLANVKEKNSLFYISRNKTLEKVDSTFNEQDFSNRALSFSTLIENDFLNTDFKDSSVIVWNNNIVVLAPEDNVMYIFDNEPNRMFWQAPIQFSGIVFGDLSIDENNNLIGHDRDTPNSYQLFTGRNDNGLAIESEAVFAYQDFGNRYGNKQLTVFAQDGYISANGVLERYLDFDFEGSRGSVGYSFRGDEMDYIYATDFESGGLGKAPLGERTLGGSTLVPAGELRRFRYADSIPMQNQLFYELRVRYRFKTLSGTWELVSYGNDAKITNDEMTDITRPNPQIVVV